MTQHATTDATVRNAALRLLANGDATMAEAAMLANVSRQRVLQWVQAAGISPVPTRRGRLARLWVMAQAGLVAGAPPLPKRKRP